tara:strand:+ start:892 stop:1182 length:291 start_codon:yes stop_codon:yes gene_type:complete
MVRQGTKVGTGRSPHEVQARHLEQMKRYAKMEAKVQQGIADGSIFTYPPKTWAEKQLERDCLTAVHIEVAEKMRRRDLAAPYQEALDNIAAAQEEE